MYSILLIEDDVEINNSIARQLQREGYKVVQSYDGKQGIEAFKNQTFDLILLDMLLPKIAGEYILSEVRETSDIPIIVISALKDEMMQYKAYENNVDDYVVKPFSLNILNYKIKAIFRRLGKLHHSVLSQGLLEIRTEDYYVAYDGKEISLTTKEFEILQLLMMNPGRVYSRDEIIIILWGYDFYGDTRNVDVHIKNIRKKIVVNNIRTIKGVGYRIDKEVE